MTLDKHLVSAWLSPEKSIVVIGDLILDRFLHGNISRLAPDIPAPVMNVTGLTECLGGAANLAHNLVTLGAPVVDLVGVIGDDEAGNTLMRLVSACNIQSRGLIVENGRQTTEKTRIVAQKNHHLVRIDRESGQSISPQTETRATGIIQNRMQDAVGVFCSDYRKGFLTPTLLRAVFEEARKLRIPVLVDPKGFDSYRYCGASILTPNIKELAELTGLICENEKSTIEAAKSLIKTTQALGVVVTCGSAGVRVFEALGSHKSMAAHGISERRTHNANGAGDSFLAAFGLAYLSKTTDLTTCAAFGNMTAAIAAFHPGTHAVTRLEVMNEGLKVTSSNCPQTVLLARNPRQAETTRIVTWPQLQRRLQDRTGDIIFTNGCFDLLHAGHISLLESSSRLGQTLVVGLNTDDSIRRLKGPNRPIVPQNARAAALAAIACVTFVILFPDVEDGNTVGGEDLDTPERLIELIRPDVLVKGGDYTLDQIKGRDIVKSYGGRVEIIPAVGNVSSTWIIDSMMRRTLTSAPIHKS